MTRRTAVVYLLVFAAALGLLQTASTQAGDRPAPDAVTTALATLGYDFDVDGDGDYKLIRHYTDGRSQLVFINGSTSTYDGYAIRNVWAPAALLADAPSQQIANRLLRQNGQVKLGAWCVIRSDDGHLAAFVAKVPADADAETLRIAIEAVGVTADELEKALTSVDEY